MHRRSRPARCAPGSSTDARQLGERLRASRERLSESELATSGQAWRLWAACVDATFGYAREADTIYVSTLARAAGVHRTKVGPLLRRFDELDVFAWTQAPRGSHGISELRLPHVAPRLHEGAHVAPRLHDEPASCSPDGSLQGNTQDVERSESHSSRGNATEDVEACTPTFDAMLGCLSSEELQRGVEEYAPTIAELYAAELERRNIAPRRRPAWLDDWRTHERHQ